MPKNKMIEFIGEVYRLVEENEYVPKKHKDSLIEELLSLDFTDNEKKIIAATDRMLDNQSFIMKAEKAFLERYGHYPNNGEIDFEKSIYDLNEEKAKLEMLVRKRARYLGLGVSITRV